MQARRTDEATARKARLVATAKEILLEQGHAAASLNEVLRLAGGSKATLVKYFRNKTGLFAAAFEELTRENIENWPKADLNGEASDALNLLGAQLLDFYLSPRCLAAYRAAVGEGYRDNSLAQALYEGGHRQVVAKVEALLSYFCRTGALRTADVAKAAGIFVHLLRSGLYEETLLGLRDEPPAPVEVSRFVAFAVALFLGGLEARHNPEKG